MGLNLRDLEQGTDFISRSSSIFSMQFIYQPFGTEYPQRRQGTCSQRGVSFSYPRNLWPQGRLQLDGSGRTLSLELRLISGGLSDFTPWKVTEIWRVNEDKCTLKSLIDEVGFTAGG